jgi:hypothetical protein
MLLRGLQGCEHIAPNHFVGGPRAQVHAAVWDPAGLLLLLVVVVVVWLLLLLHVRVLPWLLLLQLSLLLLFLLLLLWGLGEVLVIILVQTLLLLLLLLWEAGAVCSAGLHVLLRWYRHPRLPVPFYDIGEVVLVGVPLVAAEPVLDHFGAAAVLGQFQDVIGGHAT